MWQKACEQCLMGADRFVEEKGISGTKKMEIPLYCIVELGDGLFLVVYGICEKWENFCVCIQCAQFISIHTGNE